MVESCAKSCAKLVQLSETHDDEEAIDYEIYGRELDGAG